MSRIFHNPNNIKLPRRKNDEQEFSAKAGLVLCSGCGAAYFKKRWHHGLEKVKISGKNDLPVKNSICPACDMINKKQYEGRILIKNFPDGWISQLEELVAGFGRRAYDRDPMDRIIGIRKKENKKFGTAWEVTTTENELANKLASKIKSTFSKLKSRTHFAPEPSDVAEIVIEF